MTESSKPVIFPGVGPGGLADMVSLDSLLRSLFDHASSGARYFCCVSAGLSDMIEGLYKDRVPSSLCWCLNRSMGTRSRDLKGSVGQAKQSVQSVQPHCSVQSMRRMEEETARRPGKGKPVGLDG